jgi:hypothetical protein
VGQRRAAAVVVAAAAVAAVAVAVAVVSRSHNLRPITGEKYARELSLFQKSIFFGINHPLHPSIVND